MEKKLMVEGIMCCHCEAKVQKALCKLAGVKDCVASSKSGEVRVLCEDSISNEELVSTVESLGYKVVEVL